jgi:predicted site-specific integrase-resolvase
MKLSEYAKQHNIHYRTALNWFKAGKIKNAVQDKNTRTIEIQDADETWKDELIKLQKEKIEQLEAQLRNQK